MLHALKSDITLLYKISGARKKMLPYFLPKVLNASYAQKFLSSPHVSLLLQSSLNT